MNQNRRMQCNRQEAFAQDLAAREGQRLRCQCGGESGSGDAAPPGPAAKNSPVLSKHFSCMGKQVSLYS